MMVVNAHKHRIDNVAFSSDGRMVASASYDGTVKLWSIEPNAPASAEALVARPASIDGVCSWTLETWTHRGCVRSVAYSPDGEQLATAGNDGVIRIFEPKGGSFLRALVGHNDAVHCIRWSPDGQRLVSADDSGLVRIWSMPEGLSTRVFQCGGPAVRTMAWQPTGETVACGSESGTVYIWRTNSGIGYSFQACDGSAVRYLTWRGETLLTGGPDNTLKLWRPHSPGAKLLQTLKGDDTAVWPMALSPDGKSFAACSWKDGLDFKVGVYDVETGKRRAELLDGLNYRYANTLVWSPDGSTLAAGGCRTGNVTVWNTEADTPLWGDRGRTTAGHNEPTADNLDVYDVAFSPDGHQMALACASGRVVIRDARTGDPLQTLPAQTGAVRSVAFSPDGKRMASGHLYSDVRVWDTATSNSTRTFSLPAPKGSATLDLGYVTGLAFSTDGQLAATRGSAEKTPPVTTGHPVTIWDLDTGDRTTSLEPPPAWGAIAWSKNSRRIAGLGGVIWDIGTGRVAGNYLRQHQVNRALAWSPVDDTVAIGVNTGGIAVLEPESEEGEHCKHLKELGGAKSHATVVAWSPDGKLIAAGMADGKMCLWDVASEQLLCALDGHTEAPTVIRWVPGDGFYTLLSGSQKEVCFWQIGPGVRRSFLRAIAANVDAMSQDGKWIASCGESMFRLTRTTDGQVIRTTAVLRDGRNIVLAPNGHWTGPEEAADELVAVVQTDEGQETLTLQQFADKYDWQNDPSKVGSHPGDVDP